jgi:hypothetical protein
MTQEKKYFTPNSAKRTLPLVKKIVNDILSEGKVIKSSSNQFMNNPGDNPDYIKSLEKIEKFIDELAEIGCYFKDWNFEIGLVDFPAIINEEEVLLCWKSDEETLLYYHPVNGGFAARKLIPEEFYLYE